MDMDDLELPRTDTERFAVSGWSALERGDLTEARAALQDLYTADPTHPALPLLAAGIRRIRPKAVPWRAGVLLLILIVAGIAAIRTWRAQDRATPAQPATAKADTAPVPQSTALPQSPAPAEVRREVGTTGPAKSGTELPIVKQNASAAEVDEDLIVRQAVQRFEGTYRSRWGGLAFVHCDISREVNEATAICLPRSAAETSDADPSFVWRFSLRKSDGAWRIVSAQPPPGSSQ
jgi:hypothetical protein